MTRQSSFWDYTNLSDRETLLSGVLAWLLDPSGDHEGGTRLLRKLLDHTDAPSPKALDEVDVATEAKGKRGRRFDISLTEDGTRFLILEVKCKTHGSAKQLRAYAADEPEARIARVGFHEWNYPDLSEDQRARFPLITFEELAGYIRDSRQPTGPYADMVSSLTEHLRSEAEALSQLREYYVGMGGSEPPDSRGSIALSTRFVQQLFWRWFQDEYEPEFRDWKIRSQTSGVWCANRGKEASASQRLELPRLGLALPGPVRAWIHLELDGDLFGPAGARVGTAQLRIAGERSFEHRKRVFQGLRNAQDRLIEAGWSLPKRRPGKKSSYYRALRKPLRTTDLRFRELHSFVQRDLRMNLVAAS